MKNFLELLALEKSGRYEEIIREIQLIKREEFYKTSSKNINLKLLEERIKFKIKEKIYEPIRNNVRRVTSIEEEEISKIPTWSAIITMWKRLDYFAEQLHAIKTQTIPPHEIIIILNEDHLLESDIRKIGGEHLKIIHSDINSLYSRWALSYTAEGDYISVFDDDVIPGKKWIENALRACISYDALVGAAGRIYNKNGIHEFYELVYPKGVSETNKLRDCSKSDVYCDWVCNSYLFKRDWVGAALSKPRYEQQQKTFDDIQLATSLFMASGIRCVVPIQPNDDLDFHGNVKHEYGNDKYAVWLTDSNQHFKKRKSYIEFLIIHGYVPVRQRDDLHKLHLIVPFADRSYIERCLISIKGQKYKNYTCTLIDDCCDGSDQIELLSKLGLDNKRFRYLKTRKKLYGLRARELATDTLFASLSDVVIHLDGDDWLAHSHVLAKINEVYSRGDVLATYGNGVSHYPNPANEPFWQFYELLMSHKWGFSGKANDDEIKEPYRKFSEDDIQDGWGGIPWGALHLRTYKFQLWLSIDRSHFKFGNNYLRSSTDAAIFLPILAAAGLNRICFIPDCLYVYLNSINTIHNKGFIDKKELEQAKYVVKKAQANPKFTSIKPSLELIRAVRKVSDSDAESFSFTSLTEVINNQKKSDCSKDGSGAVTSIITPDYLADGFIAIKSFQGNLKKFVGAYLFVATRDKKTLIEFEKISNTIGVFFMYPESLRYVSSEAEMLESKYGLGSDEYRWAMKSLVMIELLLSGCKYVFFQDPDMLTTAPIDDVIELLEHSQTMVFPHFRTPDDDHQRHVLYRDGFFNGGFIGATNLGLDSLWQFFKNCLNEMKKDPLRNRWDDQKYLDLWVLESNETYVNQDRGLDYNPWNYEAVEGLVAPLQSSYLLASGFFIRNWHVSDNFVKQTISGDKRHLIYKPIIAIYMHTLIMIMGLLAIVFKQNEISMPPKLAIRWNDIYRKMSFLVSTDIMIYDNNTIDSINKVYSVSVTDGLELMRSIIQGGISVDNFDLYSVLIDRILKKQSLTKDSNGSYDSTFKLDMNIRLTNLRAANITLN